MYALVCRYIIITVKLRIGEKGGESPLYTSLIYAGNVPTYFAQISCLYKQEIEWQKVHLTYSKAVYRGGEGNSPPPLYTALL